MLWEARTFIPLLLKTYTNEGSVVSWCLCHYLYRSVNDFMKKLRVIVLKNFVYAICRQEAFLLCWCYPNWFCCLYLCDLYLLKDSPSESIFLSEVFETKFTIKCYLVMFCYNFIFFGWNSVLKNYFEYVLLNLIVTYDL